MKMIFSKVNVVMLDESVETFEFNPREALGADLLSMVAARLSLYEMDYFGFTVEEIAKSNGGSGTNKKPQTSLCPKWLNPMRRVRKQES